jgi:hypothetical protein
MTTKELQNSLLVALETAKTLTEILNNTIAGAHTLETMCDGIEPGTDDFAGTIAAASMELTDAAQLLAEAIAKAVPSQYNVSSPTK